MIVINQVNYLPNKQAPFDLAEFNFDKAFSKVKEKIK